MKDLTEKQFSILEYIQNYIREQGYPPTIREIGDQFEITAKGAYDHLKAIEKKGYIKCEKNRSRAIELLKTSTGQEPLSQEAVVNIPLVGRVAAGYPILAEENVDDYLAFPRSMIPEGNVFALRVAGDSMKDAGILSGDIAVIRKQEQAENGEIVVAMLEDEATLKYLFKEKKKVRLQPANKNYKPIVVNDAAIIGKLVGLYRQF
jgi:repressor LexA